jgi:hypothetical protein
MFKNRNCSARLKKRPTQRHEDTKNGKKRIIFEKNLKPGLVFSFFVALWLRVGCGFA